MICPNCEKEVAGNNLDICDDCGKDFGIGGNENNTACIHCGKGMWSQCCPFCREVLPEDMWN